MIKFFRKIRQKSLTESKFSKYLLYAIGEIVLVIIGILIALSLNKVNEKKQALAKVDAILEDVMNELASNINQGTELIYRYRESDSLSVLILNNKVTYKDYTSDNSNALWNIATGYNTYKVRDNAYNLLLNNRDAIPVAYDKAISYLNILHDKLKPNVIEYNKRVSTLVSKNFDDYEQNYEWFANRSKRDEEIEYMLHSYKFKNKVERFRMEAVYTHRGAITDYRLQAIEAYIEIARVLNKTTDSLKFLVKKNVIEKYIGTYRNMANLKEKVEVSFGKSFLKSGFLLIKIAGISYYYAYPLTSNKIFYLYNDGMVRFKTENKKIIMTIYKEQTALNYKKMD
jgi:uncharacterized membrane-anchored protein YhcB (DUF1043 family)